MALVTEAKAFSVPSPESPVADVLMKTVVTAALCAIISTVQPLWAQAAGGGGTPAGEVEPLFEVRDALFMGGVGVATLAIAPFDRKFADYLQGEPQARRFLRRMFFAVEHIAQPGAFIIGGGLYAAGKLSGNDEMADVGLHGTEAIAIGLVVTSAIKFSAGRARPYVNREDPYNFGFMRGLTKEEYRSFPSGHTLIAFAAASAVTDETRRFWPDAVWLIGPALYSGAALVGVSRMYNNKHWASDVIMGGAIGVFSGLKVVKYHHSHPGNRIDRWLLGVSIGHNEMGARATRLIIVPQRD